MPTHKLRRGATLLPGETGTAQASPIYVDSDTSTIKVVPGATGTTEKELVDTNTAQTLSNKTIDTPTITGVGNVQSKASSADFTADSGGTGSTLTNIAGLTGFAVEAGATYNFRIVIPKVTQTANGGAKFAFKLTTATLASINGRFRASTDTDNTGAVSTSFTSTADQGTWIDQKTTVYTNYEFVGSFVTTLAGTLAIQAAQNTSHADTTTVTKGVTASFTRVA